jgi:hypothetical protein
LSIAECRSSVMYEYASLPSFLLRITETVRLTENFIAKMFFFYSPYKFCSKHFCFSSRFDSCSRDISRSVSAFKRCPLFLSEFNRNWNIEFYCDSSVDFHKNVLFFHAEGQADRQQRQRETSALQIYEEAWQTCCALFLCFFFYKRASAVCNDLLTLSPPPDIPNFLGGGVVFWVQLFLSYICFPSLTDIPFSSVVYLKLMIDLKGTIS